MNSTSVNSSKRTSKGEVGINTNDMNFKISGAFLKIDREKNMDFITIDESQTINQSVPLFEIAEKSVYDYTKTVDAKGRTIRIDNENRKKYVTVDGKTKVYRISEADRDSK